MKVSVSPNFKLFYEIVFVSNWVLCGECAYRTWQLDTFLIQVITLNQLNMLIAVALHKWSLVLG